MNKCQLFTIFIYSVLIIERSNSNKNILLFTNIPHTQPEPIRIGTYDSINTGIRPGVLIRNGFGEFSSVSVAKPYEFNHLFDSLSLILKFNFTLAGEVYFQSRMQPSAYYNESLRTVPLYRTLGGFSPNFTAEQTIQTLEHTMHDNLNANIIPVSQGYLAISDLQGGNLLDKVTLSFMGNQSHQSPIMTSTHDGWLEYNYITSTHPLSHPKYPDIIYNFDAIIRVHPIDPLAIKYEYRFYTWDRRDWLDLNKTVFYTLPANKLSYVHSFSLTNEYIIFFEYPMFWDIPAMFIHTSILPTIYWDPTVNTRIHVIDIRTGTLAMQLDTEPVFAFHHINAFYIPMNSSQSIQSPPSVGDNLFKRQRRRHPTIQSLLERAQPFPSQCLDTGLKPQGLQYENGEFTVDILTYPNGSIFGDFYLAGLRRGGPHTSKYPAGRVMRFSWNFDSTRVSWRILSDRMMELPAIDPLDRGQPYRYFYAVGNDYAIYRVDLITGAIRGWSTAGHYPSEPVFIPPRYLASVTLDTGRNKSYLLLLDSDTMDPLSTTSNNFLWLDTWIPLTCHGNWIST